MRRELLGTLALLVLGAGLAVAQKPELLPAPEAAPKADAKPEGKGSGPAVQSTVDAKEECVVEGTPLWTGCENDCKSGKKKCCNTPGCAWVSAEYLYWWLKDAPLPDGGALFPGQFDYNPASGVRWSAGIHNEDGTIGLEGGMFFLERRAVSLSADASATGISIPPFLNIPAGAGATATLTAGNRFWGGEALLTKAAFGQYCKKASYQVDLLGGFQFLDLNESFESLTTATLPAGAVFQFGNTVIVGPANATADAALQGRNQFFGGQLGIRGEFRTGRLFVFGSGRCGLGLSHQHLSLLATTTGTAGGTTTTATTALDAVHDEFAIVPQVTLNIGYQVTRNLRVYAGYDYLYWSNVARPGDNVLFAVPGAGVDQTNFYTHGVNFGAGWHF